MPGASLGTAPWLILAASAVPLLGQRVASSSRVAVGPNILVSWDYTAPHIEPTVAVHPTDANVLVAGAFVEADLETRAGAYASHDGGYTWQYSVLPLQDAGDPQLAIGATGTVYYAALGIGGSLFVARSADGGLTWNEPVFLGAGQDHPQISIDRTGGRFAGRIYVSSAQGCCLGVFWSDDDGRTWHGPQPFLQTGPGWGQNTTTLLVLSDGTLFASFDRWTRTGKPAEDSSYAGFALSTNGGQTFAPPQTIRILRAANLGVLAGRPSQAPEYAVNSQSSIRRDRIFMVFPRDSLGRVYVQYSDDRGGTWSDAKQVDPGVPPYAEQFQQMVAVNKDGVVGVTWFDTRSTRDRSAYDQYFAASVDGGETFLPAERVSTDSTVPLSPGNLRYRARSDVMRDTAYINVGTIDRLEIGGDYMGLAADEEGVFHSVWTDARSGTYQLYTSAIRVFRTAQPVGTAYPAEMRVRTLRASEFAVVFDPARFDAASGIISVPFRVKNLTAATWYAPMTLRLEVNPSLGDRGKIDARFYPTILGASNGKTGPGAEFDLTPVMGSAGVILPGATTESFILRIKRRVPDAPLLGRIMPDSPLLGRMMTFISVATP